MTRFDLNRSSGSHHSQHLRGVYLGIVTGNNKGDGANKFQLKLRFPWLPSGSSEESFWARIAVPMAGKERGTYFLPEIDDQVLVVFIHGEIERPVVIGSLWSGQDKPPENNQNGENNLRLIKSRAGHRLILDDTSGSERVILTDSTKKNKILLDTANDVVTVETADGDIDIKASKVVRMHGKAVNITTKGAFKAKGMQLTISTKGPINTKASGTLKLQAANVQTNGA
ncbi:phage baseplate assembly protein V [Haliangium ochraceum]|uniref:Rhs element Vgr protein n=1 Tax=Haliangium ochraceum (strain DSM 14365 / JCM 11303 / SMP-2) TaxID=502025 RepID=D0LXC5_HALO1|nr:phage baseplate assembly protein V [Haliangium ochraceum]ACY16167.1 Rhs element Vgr protein [Haliangium ochraceum DSM 14365]